MPNRSPLSKIHFKKPLSNEADVGEYYPPSFSSPLVPTSAVTDVVESKFWWLPDSAAAVGETFALVAIICSLLVNNIRPNFLYIFVPVALSLIAGCVMRVIILTNVHHEIIDSENCLTSSCDKDACLGICRITSEIIVLLAKLVLFFRYSFAYQTILNSVDAKSFLIRFDQNEIPTTPLLPNVDFFPIDCTLLSVCIAFELLEGYYLMHDGLSGRLFYKYNKDAYRSLLDSVLGYSCLLVLTVLTHSRDVVFFSNFFKYLPWFYVAVTLVRYFIALRAPFLEHFYHNDDTQRKGRKQCTCTLFSALLYKVRVETLVLLSATFVAVYQFVDLKTSLVILFITLIVERIAGGYFNINDTYEKKREFKTEGYYRVQNLDQGEDQGQDDDDDD